MVEVLQSSWPGLNVIDSRESESLHSKELVESKRMISLKFESGQCLGPKDVCD